MKRNLSSPKRTLITICLLGLALYLVITAQNALMSIDTASIAKFFGSKPHQPTWSWCPAKAEIGKKSSKFNNLTQNDLGQICRLQLESANTDELKELEKGFEILSISDGHKTKTLVGSPNLQVFSIDGMPFKNKDLTAFLKSKIDSSQP